MDQLHLVTYGRYKGPQPKFSGKKVPGLTCVHFPNPHNVPELKDLTGRDKPVQDFILGYEMLPWHINTLATHASTFSTIAISCHGGRHRSVAFAEIFARTLEGKRDVILSHYGLGLHEVGPRVHFEHEPVMLISKQVSPFQQPKDWKKDFPYRVYAGTLTMFPHSDKLASPWDDPELMAKFASQDILLESLYGQMDHYLIDGAKTILIHAGTKSKADYVAMTYHQQLEAKGFPSQVVL